MSREGIGHGKAPAPPGQHTAAQSQHSDVTAQPADALHEFARYVSELAGCVREFARGGGELAGCVAGFARCVSLSALGAQATPAGVPEKRAGPPPPRKRDPQLPPRKTRPAAPLGDQDR